MSFGLTYRGVFKLDNAVTRYELSVPDSTYIKILSGTDITTEINVAIENDSNGSNFIPMSRGADLQIAQGFDKIILSWSAQAGKQVEIICAAVEGDFKLTLPEKTEIEGIADAVKVINDTGDVLDVKDADAETALNAILAMLQNDEDQRAALTTLEGATYWEKTGAGGSETIVTAGANTGGIILRLAGIRSEENSTNESAFLVDGNPILMLASRDLAEKPQFIQNIRIPAGVAFSATLVGTTYNKMFAWYEVL